MLDFLIGKAGMFLALGAVVLTTLGGLLYKSKKAGVDEQKAKEAKARERNLERIKAAAAARDAVRPADGGVQSDKRNRDNQRRV